MPDETYIFIPAYGYTTGEYGISLSFHHVQMADGVEKVAYFDFIVPQDFDTFVSVEAVWFSLAEEGDMYWKLSASWAAKEEALDKHTEDTGYDTTATGGMNIVNVQEHASPLTMASLSAGDLVGIEFSRDASHEDDTLDTYVKLLGLLFTYNKL